MKRIVTILTVAILGLMVSCNKEQLELAPGSGDVVTVKSSLKISPLTNYYSNTQTGTKAQTNGGTTKAIIVPEFTQAFDAASNEGFLTSAEEYAIKNIWVVQFKDADIANGIATKLTDTDMTNRDPLTGGYNISTILSPSNAEGRLYIFANMKDGVFVPDVGEITEAWLNKIANLKVSKATDYRTDGLPMQGYYKGEIVEGFDIGEIELSRLVARVNFYYDFSLSFLDVSPQTVQLKNAPTIIYPGSRIIGETALTTANLPTGVEKFLFNDYGTLAATRTSRMYTWYVPMNLKGIDMNMSDERKRIVKNAPNLNPTYIELTCDANIAGIKETVKYQFMLGHLDGTEDGDESVKGNFNTEGNKTYNIGAKILGAGIHLDSRVTAVRSGPVDFGGKGIIRGLANSVVISPVTGSTAEVNLARIWEGNPAQNAFGVLTDYTGLTTGVVWTDNTKIKINSTFGDISENEYTEDELRTLKIPILSGDHVYLKNVLRFNVASINEQGNVIIAVKKDGKTLWSWHVWVTQYTPDALKLLADAEVDHKIDGQWGTSTASGEVHTYGTQYGVANDKKVIMDRNLGAIAAFHKAPTSNLKNPPAGGVYNAEIAWGLFYQWGRKDPFPRISLEQDAGYLVDGSFFKYGDEARKNTIPTDVIHSIYDNMLQFSIEFPERFIKSSGDWFTLTKLNNNDYLWSTKTDQAKGIYDPCPEGWRVPSTSEVNGTWSDFKYTASQQTIWYNKIEAGSSIGRSNGFIYKYEPKTSVTGVANVTKGAWYPAQGLIDGSRAVIYVGNSTEDPVSKVGKDVTLWSHLPISDSDNWLAWHLVSRFPDGMYPHTSRTRATGLPVRCIQDSEYYGGDIPEA